MTDSDVSSRRSPRAVSFSEYSELVVYVPKCDPSTSWYSAMDRKRFRQTLINEARRLSHEIQELHPDDVMSHEQLCDCLGIEAFLGGKKYAVQARVQARRAHIAAVLTEQCIQKKNGMCDIERLSKVSMMGSKWSSTRAGLLATRYAEVLMD